MKIRERVDDITNVRPEWARPVLPAPKAAKIELTARCDFACPFCVTGQRRRPATDMAWDLLVRLLREIRAAGVEEIGLFYLGESMLYSSLVDAVRVAKQECGYPYVFLTTNGRLTNPERVYACASVGLDSLKFSLNAADRLQFKQIMQVDAFDQVVSNIKGARAAVDRVAQETGRRCRLYVSSILYDEQQRARMRQVIAEITPYIDQHYYLAYQGPGPADITPEAEPFVGAVGRLGAVRDPLPCWSVFKEAHVTVQGCLSACCWDHDERFTMGDLKTMSFMEAWNSERFQALRRAHLRRDVTGTVCEHCVSARTPASGLE